MRVRVAVSGARMLHERLKREVETMIANLVLEGRRSSRALLR